MSVWQVTHSQIPKIEIKGEGVCLFQWVEKYVVRKRKCHINIHAVGRILSRDTSVYTAVRTLRCSPSVHITDIIFQHFWFVCKKYAPMWLVTIWNALNFATVWPTSLLNSGRPWNSILAMEARWVMLILVFVSPSGHSGQYLKIGHKSCLSRPLHKTISFFRKSLKTEIV